MAEVAPEVPIAQVDTPAQVYRDHPSMSRSGFSLALLAIAGAAPRSVKGLFVYRGMILSSIGIAVGAVAAAR